MKKKDFRNYLQNGVPPHPGFCFDIESIPYDHLRQAYCILQSEEQRITLSKLRQLDEQENVERKAIEDHRNERMEVEEARFRLVLLHQTLKSWLSTNWAWPIFEKFLEQHINNKNSIELRAFEDHTARILNEDAVRNKKRAAVQVQVEKVVVNTPPHYDLKSAILYFKERERKIVSLDLESQDKEMLLIRLAEKRSRVLDQYI